MSLYADSTSHNLPDDHEDLGCAFGPEQRRRSYRRPVPAARPDPSPSRNSVDDTADDVDEPPSTADNQPPASCRPELRRSPRSPPWRSTCHLRTRADRSGLERRDHSARAIRLALSSRTRSGLQPKIKPSKSIPRLRRIARSNGNACTQRSAQPRSTSQTRSAAGQRARRSSASARGGIGSGEIAHDARRRRRA